MGKLYTIENVPILKTGKFIDANGVEIEFTDENLQEIVENTNALLKAKQHEPPLKLGHNEEQKIADGLPAIGWVAKLKKVGNQVFADLKDIPKKVYNLILNRAYKKVSSEIYQDPQFDENNKVNGLVLRALSLLGADIPAIKGLGDIELLYIENQPVVISFSESDLAEIKDIKSEGKIMDKNVWTLDRVEKSLPCCVDAVKKFMEEKKINEIDVEDLIKIIADIKMAENKKDDKEDVVFENKSMSELVAEFNSITPEKLAEIKNKLQDERPPKGWWDDCIKSVPSEVTDPEALCGWIYYHWMSPERKQEIEATRASEPENQTSNNTDGSAQINSTSDDVTLKKEEQKSNDDATKKTEEQKSDDDAAKLKELENKLKQKEIENIKDKIKDIVDKNRNVFLPKFDNYINTLTEFIASDSKVVKFSDQEVKIADIFVNFLSEIAKDKTVIFEELAKANDIEKYEKIFSDEVEIVKKELKDKYQNIKDNYSFAEKDIELVAYATVISKKENISFTDALKKAKEKLS